MSMPEAQSQHPQPVTAAAMGSAYGRPEPVADMTLASVGPGTPTGEYLRRYWHPVEVSAKVTDRPQMVRILGEDLVIFRNRSGEVGLLYPRCMHRGSSLYYGKVTDTGIRCCYHGWLFGVDGTCLEQPCEPENGLHRDKARQPWYPVEERYGLVFAYLGPPEKKPILPRYDILENLQDGEFLEILGEGNGFGGYGDHVANPIIPYNWLQNWENIVDPYHVQVLHTTFSGTQFVDDFGVMPTVDFEAVPEGIIYHAHRDFDDGRSMVRVNSAIFPNISAIPAIDMSPVKKPWVGWHVAVDDANHRGFFVARNEKIGSFDAYVFPNGKTWLELSEAERRDYPGDFEAQASQGPIQLHSEEHLATSDRGIAMLRRLMKKQIKVVADGGDPIGVVFDEAQALIAIRSGNFFKDGSPSNVVTADA